MPPVNNDTLSVIRGGAVAGYYIGYMVGEHTLFDGPWASFTIYGYEIPTQNHPITGRLGAQESQTAIYFSGTGSGAYVGVDLMLELEYCPSGDSFSGCMSWNTAGNIIVYGDTSYPAAHGIIRYHMVEPNIGPAYGPITSNANNPHLQFYNLYSNEYSPGNTAGAVPSLTGTGCGSAATYGVAVPGSNDVSGTAYCTTGSGTASSGTFVLTFAAPRGTHYPGCVCSLLNSTMTWNARATCIVAPQANNTSTTFNWDNNGTAISNSVAVNYYFPGW